MQAYLKHIIMRFVVPWLVYRLPLSLAAPLLPKYRFGIEPAQLACLTHLIDCLTPPPPTHFIGKRAVICEIGIGRGYTSIFLLEHLRRTANPTTALFIDTFKGFTDESISYEIRHYGKTKRDLPRSKNYSPERIAKHWRRLGYDNFKIIAQDCAQVDWEAVGPIAVALLDVDLYLPTKISLANIWPHIIPGGAILIDDCDADSRWPGALPAVTEFIEEHNLSYRQIGSKGILLQKQD